MRAPSVRFADVQAVLFDLDGTLIDSAPDLGSAANKMRQERGLPWLPLEQYRPMVGSGARGMLGIALAKTPDHPEFAALKEEFFANYENCMTQHTRVFDGVTELVNSLLGLQIPWGVVTNKSKRFAVPITKGMPLFASASVIVCGDTTPHAKPHPEPLLEAARRMNIDPSRCMYVGDDERDVIAGLAAAMMTVAVTYGYLGQQTDIQLWGADATINSIGEILQLIAKP